MTRFSGIITVLAVLADSDQPSQRFSRCYPECSELFGEVNTDGTDITPKDGTALLTAFTLLADLHLFTLGC